MWYIVCIAFLSPHALCFKSSHLFLHFAFSELLDTWRVAQHCNQHDRRPGPDATRPLPEAWKGNRYMNKNMYCISINEYKWIWMTCFIFRFVPPLYLAVFGDSERWMTVSLEVKHHLGWRGRFPGSLYSHAYQWSLGPFEIVRKVKGCQKVCCYKKATTLPQSWGMQQFKLSVPYIDWIVSELHLFQAVVWQLTWEPPPLSMNDMQHASFCVLGVATA